MVENGTVLENGMTVMTDGTVTKPDGTSMMMEDGMMMDMDGMVHMMDEDMEILMKQRSMEAPGMMEHDGQGMDGEAQAEVHRTWYTKYAPEVLTDGQTKVLFFHAAWCPVCKQADATLRALYNAGNEDMPFEELVALLPDRSVYRVDYDTEADLKAQYGVTYQHTFVVVDGQGNMITKIQGPTDDQLKALLQG